MEIQRSRSKGSHYGLKFRPKNTFILIKPLDASKLYKCNSVNTINLPFNTYFSFSAIRLVPSTSMKKLSHDFDECYGSRILYLFVVAKYYIVSDISTFVLFLLKFQRNNDFVEKRRNSCGDLIQVFFFRSP
jgi:hypothetical protein